MTNEERDAEIARLKEALNERDNEITRLRDRLERSTSTLFEPGDELVWFDVDEVNTAGAHILPSLKRLHARGVVSSPLRISHGRGA